MSFNSWDLKAYSFYKDMGYREDGNTTSFQEIGSIGLADYSRIFFAGKNNIYLFSKKNQELVKYDLNKNVAHNIGFKSTKPYGEVEYCDKKFFCLDAISKTIDIFVQKHNSVQIYKKCSIDISDGFDPISDEYQMKLLKQTATESGSIYRCLLGPVKSNLFLYCDIKESLIEGANKREKRPKLRLNEIRITDDYETLPEFPAIAAFDEHTQKLIYIKLSNDEFWEYNGFSGAQSKQLNVVHQLNADVFPGSRMYFYYPHMFFEHKLQHQFETFVKEKQLEEFFFCHMLICNPGSNHLVVVQPGKDDYFDIQKKNRKIPGINQLGAVYYCNTYALEGFLSIRDLAIDEAQGGLYILTDKKLLKMRPGKIGKRPTADMYFHEEKEEDKS